MGVVVVVVLNWTATELVSLAGFTRCPVVADDYREADDVREVVSIGDCRCYGK